MAWATGAVAFLASTAYAFASGASEAGWQPLVVLWGGGESADAVRALRRVTGAFGIALHHTEIDRATQRFLDDSLDDLQNFNLADFFERLPEQNGEYRELWVRGELTKDKYLVRRSRDLRADRVSLSGPRRELAASSITVRAKPVRGRDHTYFLGYRAGLGVGPLRWDRAVSAMSDWERLLATGAPQPAVQAGGLARGQAVEAAPGTKKQVRALNPGLGEEDVAVLALLFESFPAFSTALARLGRVEDVRTVWHDRGYQALHVALRGLPERFEEHYRHFSRHLDHMGRIAHAHTRWLDAQGRTLAEFELDSDALTLSARCYVKDGKLLPWRGATVYEGEPVDPFGPLLARTKFVSDLRFKMLGVIMKLGQVALDASYEPRPGSAQMSLHFTRVPKDIQVEGAALGFVPTGFLDLFIPGNIESITRDFLTVAAKGNNGRGVVASLTLGTADQETSEGVLDAAIELDAIDNFLVKVGVSMVNERVVPDDYAVQDAKRFVTDLHDAFVHDLDRFAARCQCDGR